MTRRMISSVVAVFAMVSFMSPPAAATPPGESAEHARRYYVSLGDSLSRGMQADPATGQSVLTEPDEGYAEQLYERLREDLPKLRHVELGCHLGDESTASMISGGACVYPKGSQLEEAESFLRAHGKFVALVTIDIGANDVRDCLSGAEVEQSCVLQALNQVQTNVAEIMARLRAAAGPGVPIVGMTYYNPYLAAWLQGPAGQALAQDSTQLAVILNQILRGVYGSAGSAVAPVEEAFSTTDFATMVEMPPFGSVPLNVARICQWTWMCTHGNIHANASGYAVMADAFEAVIEL